VVEVEVRRRLAEGGRLAEVGNDDDWRRWGNDDDWRRWGNDDDWRRWRRRRGGGGEMDGRVVLSGCDATC
jgi:hypothetical protein